MALVGPGAIQAQTEDIKPLLDGASEYEYVTILNPLSDDFAVRVAQDIPVNMPLDIRSKTGSVQNENDVIRSYGLDLKNPDFKGRKHIVNDTIIEAGHTINLKGNEAQVAVRQLVNEILQREGHQRLVADPTLRREVEERIIIGRGSIQEIMDNNFKTVHNQIDDAINKSNEVEDEPFPEFNSEATGRSAETGADSRTNSTPSERRSPGRPKKTQQYTQRVGSRNK